MTTPKSASWAREKAERLLYRWVEECALRPTSFRAWLTDQIESALLAVEWRAKEECARIAESKQDRTRRSHIIAAAIRATFPPTSKTE